ncbi:MAG: hypothetical protein E6J34_19505, partial [Chloroflexi bacterium]
TAVKIRNRLPTKALNGRTPHEVWFNERHRPSIRHFRQFGCIAYAQIPIKNIGRSNKVAPRSIQCCYLGVIGTKLYRLWDPVHKRIVISRDVIFHENQFLNPSVFGNIQHSQHKFQTPFDPMNDTEPTNYIVSPHPPRPAYRPTPPAANRASQAQPSTSTAFTAPIIPRPTTYEFSDSESDHEELPFTPIQTKIIQLRHSNRSRQPSHKARENQAQAKLTTTTPSLQHIPSFAPPEEPSSIEEALRSPHATQWLEAYHIENNSLEANGTWTLVPRPVDRKVIGTKVVFRLKDAETPTPRFKARIVAQGYTQIPGLDYTDTFAPVVKAASIRILFAIAFILQLLIFQFDFETAFLNTKIDHEVYVEQPPYLEVRNRRDWVYLLNKALYGLKQSPLLWSNDLKDALIEIGFEQSIADESIFVYDKNGFYIIIAVYVDDILALAKTHDEIQFVYKSLSQKFKLRNLGPVKKFLGLDIYRPTPTGPVYLSQSTYARKMLHKFYMAKCNPVKTPCESSVQLHKRTPDEESANGELYRQMIGSLMFLAQYARPDISYAVSALSQFNKDPSIHHFRAVKHLLRYIQATKDLSIVFNGNSNNSLIGYSDANYANNPDDRKSTSGILFFIANGIISFQSSKQSVIAMSTMESEYMALSEAAKEAIFLLKLLRSLKFDANQPVLIKTDSESALDHVKNNVKHARTKHIDIRHHFIRSACSDGHVTLQHVPSASQIADVLTKPLGATKHAEAIKMLNLVPFPPTSNTH